MRFLLSRQVRENQNKTGLDMDAFAHPESHRHHTFRWHMRNRRAPPAGRKRGRPPPARLAGPTPAEPGVKVGQGARLAGGRRRAPCPPSRARRLRAPDDDHLARPPG